MENGTDPNGEPTEPKLRILQINLIGVIYTLKLAMHYLRAQPEADARDRCFIFKGSIAGLIDQPASWQYSTSKFGLRGLMRSARRTSWSEGIRVNYVAPWYVLYLQWSVKYFLLMYEKVYADQHNECCRGGASEVERG
jgi:NAD(P)-dependent dehydrogenase (short-subunit alcohol dehydrogenase family)